MANTQHSYEFSNQVRDLTEGMDMLVKEFPTLISQIRTGSAATNHKVEWEEDFLAPSQTTISSFSTDGDGTGIVVADSTGITVGTVLRFETAAGGSLTEQALVTAVDSGTHTLTVTRDYGSTTGVTLAATNVVKIVSRPLAEGTTATSTANYQPELNYNYTQIFDRAALLTRTAIQTNMYGSVAQGMAYQIRRKMIELMMEDNNQLIHGRRVQRSGSNNGSAGGILQFLEGGNVDTTGGAISKTIINNVLQSIYQDGGYSSNYALLCADNQARKISAFNTAGTNPLVMTSPDSREFGGYISSFVGDLPVQNGFMAKIIVDPNFPKDKIAIIDLNAIEKAVMQPLTEKPATPDGADYIQQRILGEWTYRIKNGAKSHGLATGLTV